MTQSVLWGSPITLPAGILMPQVTALSNGTFLVVGKTADFMPKAWIYNADGSLKHERAIEIPDIGPENPRVNLDRAAIDLKATEHPDGRIALTWTSDLSDSGYVTVWSGLYSADLTRTGFPVPITTLDPGSGDTNFYHFDAAVSLGNGSLIISYRHESDQKAFLRILGPDGVLSDIVELGSAYTNPGMTVTALTPLPNGSVVAAVRKSADLIEGYLVASAGSGAPVRSNLFSINSQGTLDEVTVTALKDGGFAVAYMDGISNSSKAFVRIYGADGDPVTDHIPITTATGTITSESPKLLALPNGGFAVAYEKAIKIHNGGAPGREVYLASFDAGGNRVTDDLRVSAEATDHSFDVAGLSLMGDGRIVVHHSGGLRIVDPRDAAVSLKGTAGSDHYIGTAFNDIFSGSAGADRLNGGAGADYVSFTEAKSGVTASLSGGTRGDAAGDVYTGIEGLLGSSSSDILTGNGSAVLMGRRGNDIYYAKAKDSVREATGEGRDTVISSGSYALRSDAEVEVLKLSGIPTRTAANLTGSNTANEITGHAGTNILKGQGGDDVIKASSGNDSLYGGTGNDTLTGESGRDVFVFDLRPSSSNVDRIVDFRAADDSIFLDNAVFTKLGRGNTAGVRFNSDMFVEHPSAKDREDRIVYDRSKGALYYDADGKGSIAQVKIATLANKAKLYWHDFYVI